MDVNGLPIEGFDSVNITSGIGAMPPLSADLQTPVEALKADHFPELEQFTESEMERLIMDYKATRNVREAEEFLREEVPEKQMDRFLDSVEQEL